MLSRTMMDTGMLCRLQHAKLSFWLFRRWRFLFCYAPKSSALLLETDNLIGTIRFVPRMHWRGLRFHWSHNLLFLSLLELFMHCRTRGRRFGSAWSQKLSLSA